MEQCNLSSNSPYFQEAITTFIEGDVLYKAMLDSIYTATNEILIESYIFELDVIGKQFIEALNHKAKQGVVIKLHLDAVGSHKRAKGEQFEQLLDANITLKWFNRWRWQNPLQFNVRNHRKLLLIDRKSVFFGGFNIQKDNSKHHFGKTRWRDSHLKIDSDIVELFCRYFDDLWHKRRQTYLGNFDGLDLIPNLSINCRYLLRCRLNQLIESAESQLLCTTPYFLPDEFLIKALIKAAQRGVDVQLLVPYQSDHQLINVLAEKYYTRLIQAGINIYAYLPRLLHAKTLVIDNKMVMIGSANMDYRSLFINHELMCLFKSKTLAQEMTQCFVIDKLDAKQITAKTKYMIKQWWLWRPLAALLKHWL